MVFGKDFNNNIADTLDEVLFLAKLRDEKWAELHKLKVYEVKNIAKALKIPIKASFRKDQIKGAIVKEDCRTALKGDIETANYKKNTAEKNDEEMQPLTAKIKKEKTDASTSSHVQVDAQTMKEPVVASVKKEKHDEETKATDGENKIPPPQVPEPPEPEAADAMDKPKDVITLHPQTAKVFGSEAEGTNMDTEKEENLLSTFLPNLGEETQKKEESNKVLFRDAEVIVPGISLKKMKMALDNDPNPAVGNEIIAVLGSTDVTKYRYTRPCLAGMVVGNPIERQEFWDKVGQHLEKRGALAIMRSANSVFSITDVSRSECEISKAMFFYISPKYNILKYPVVWI